MRYALIVFHERLSNNPLYQNNIGYELTYWDSRYFVFILHHDRLYKLYDKVAHFFKYNNYATASNNIFFIFVKTKSNFSAFAKHVILLKIFSKHELKRENYKTHCFVVIWKQYEN